MKKDILFLCQFFYPEYNSSATLPWDSAKYFAQHGLSVGVLCGYPKEYNNSGEVPLKEEVSGVSIHRLKYIQLKRGKKLSRLINYFSFTLAVFLHIGVFRKYKTVMVYSNPPVLPLIAVLANLLFGTKIVFVSYDVYPEVAYASKSLVPTGLIAKVMRLINKMMCKRVSKIVALSSEMKQFLLENRKLKESQIEVIPNWAHEERRIRKENDYKRFGYTNADFIVSYFGNMGICQDVETMLGAIELLKEESHIKFFIVGHGTKKEYVESCTKNNPNVQVLDFLQGEDFEKAVSISSCSIVSLEKGLKGMCAPSKYYSYLQGGIPVLSITESDSYLALEIEKEKVGKAIEIGDCSSLAKTILELSKNINICDEMSQKAIRLYDQEYRMEVCLDKYIKILNSLL